jgi:tRNA dimethylallyltransferase
MVGGSGLFVDAVIYDYSFSNKVDDSLRQELSRLNVVELQERLRLAGIDLPFNAKNPRHLIRALETRGQTSQKKPLRPNTLIIGLKVEPAILDQRIRQRVSQMLTAGLEQEVRKLSDQYSWNLEPLKAIGYREFKPYFEGECDIEQVTQEIVRASRAYAKRQMTWFKRNKSIHWICKSDEAVDLITTFLNK